MESCPTTYQEELREKQVVAVWLGDIASEDALVEYLGVPFEHDFGFLLDQDALPEFAYAFESQPNPPDLSKRKSARCCTVPFDRNVAAGKLFSGFSHGSEWAEEALQACKGKGMTAAIIALAFRNLRYRPELWRNSQSPVKFLGNFHWPGGLGSWELEERRRVIKPPFPTLVRRESGGWQGVARLPSWKGFASYKELSDWSPLHGCLPDGDLHLGVDSPDESAAEPTEVQSKSFEHYLQNDVAVREAILGAIFKVYPEWRSSYFVEQSSFDGGKTWQSGWDLPEQYPPDVMPEVGSPDDLRKLIKPESVSVMSSVKDDFVRIGFYFRCKWDEEHGLGVSTRRGEVDASFASD